MSRVTKSFSYSSMITCDKPLAMEALTVFRISWAFDSLTFGTSQRKTSNSPVWLSVTPILTPFVSQASISWLTKCRMESSALPDATEKVCSSPHLPSIVCVAAFRGNSRQTARGIGQFKSFTTECGVLPLSSPKTCLPHPLGVALGAGAARGLSHVGFLKELSSRGITFPVVAGTSIGAIVGAAYACGKLDLAEEVAKSITPRNMIQWADIVFGGSALFKGNLLKSVFRQLTGGQTFEELRGRGVFFSVVACDLKTGETVYLNQGSVADAVRASMSIPGIFEPVSYRGRLLVDGGIVGLVPTDAARALGAAKIVAVNVFHPKDIWMYTADGLRLSVAGFSNTRKKPRRRWSVLSSLLQAMEVMNTSLALGEKEQLRDIEMTADLVIRPSVGKFKSHQFYKAKPLIEAGEEAARENIEQILNLAGVTPVSKTHNPSK